MPAGSTSPPPGPPPFYILLNGSKTFHTYTVKPGQTIVLLVDISSNETLPVSINATGWPVPPPGFRPGPTASLPASGISYSLSAKRVTTPASGITLTVSIPNSVSPGLYWSQVVVSYNPGSGQTNQGMSDGFDLNVE
jgi:hypothetical protein